MKNLKKRIGDLSIFEKKEIGNGRYYKFIPKIGLILIDEQIWWECDKPEEGKKFLEQLGLKEAP